MSAAAVALNDVARDQDVITATAGGAMLRGNRSGVVTILINVECNNLTERPAEAFGCQQLLKL